MFKFFIFSYQEWWMKQPHSQSLSIINSISHWLNDVSLFDSAWRKVSVGVWPWLWSHQLCSLTVSVWTPLLAIEGTRRNIPYVWAYMLLGQVVAISVASALFFVVMLTHTPIPSRQPSEKLLKSLSVSTIGGLITVILSPFVASTELFMPNLLIMHILLILPLIYKQHHQQQNNKPSYSITIFIMLIYTIAAGANLAIYVNQWFECLTTISLDTNSSIFIDIYHKVVNTFFSHPAQSSISYDIVCMQLISTAWMWVYSRSNFTEIPKWTYALMIITPLLSASVTLPLFIVGCEYQHLLLDNKKIS
ncbi:uncharacterized protein BX663DRAFT_483433 [Cokeromyces recurvatus]|uniref:uncharacterized protein n=1 Tax=Cokeromyces recurvatus TaxID=90255 RepID=UPI00221EAF46|nr:uncharacterized protein BX663DRAFT_483433 [Cokeromyces recurvatus]KAI7906741.1 hypothetical protein BX663DRAFT_483433 [Cokeromyces recurvatus]